MEEMVVATAIEIETEDTVDHAMMTLHERDLMKVVVTMKILVSCEDTKHRR